MRTRSKVAWSFVVAMLFFGALRGRRESHPGDPVGGALALESAGIRVVVDAAGAVEIARAGAPPGAGGATRFELQAVSVGERRAPLAGRPEVVREAAGSLAIRRPGGVVERYEAHAEGVEQTITLAERPPGGPGDLVLEARLSSGLDRALAGPEGERGVRLSTPGAAAASALAYGAAVAIDARGARRAARMGLDGETLRIVVDGGWVAGAAFPLVIDPLIGTVDAASQSFTDERRPDVAYSATQDGYLIVYDEAVPSAADRRVMARRYSAKPTGTPTALGDAFALDAAAAKDTAGPATAWSGGSTDAFLVAWLDRTGKRIEGAIVSATVTAGGVTPLAGPIATLLAGESDIVGVRVGGRQDGAGWAVVYDVLNPTTSEVHGVVVSAAGVPGAIFEVVSRGDARQAAVNKLAAPGAPWLLAFAEDFGGGDVDVRFGAVSPAGLLGAISTLDETPETDDRPAVAGLVAPWLIAYNRTDPASGDRDIRAVFATETGLAGSPFAVSVTAAHDDRAPCAEALEDEFLISWTRAANPVTTTSDIACARLAATGTQPAFREKVTALTPGTGAAGFALAPRAVARITGSTLTAEYLVVFERDFSSTFSGDADPQYARFGGSIAPLIDLRERTAAGRVVTSGSPDGTARVLPVAVTGSSSTPLTLVLTNAGARTLTAGVPASTSPDFVVDAGAFPASIAPGGAASFSVRFSPTAPGGPKAATVNFSHDAAGAPNPFAFEVASRAVEGPPVPTSTSVLPALAIPDDDPAGIRSSIVMRPGLGLVTRATVDVSITHSFDADLVLSLTGPTGRRIALANRRGSNRRGEGGQDFTGTTFDDAAATPIAGGTAPFTGAFVPDELLSAFQGLAASGTWTLEVADVAATDAGTLDGWTLHLETFRAPGAALEVHEGSVSGPVITSGAAAAGGRAFGSQVVGTTSPAEVAIALLNDGVATLNVSGARASSPDFILLGVPAQIAPGASATFRIRFEPRENGSKNATVSFDHDSGLVPSSFRLDVSGTGIPPAASVATFAATGSVRAIPDLDAGGTVSAIQVAAAGLVVTNVRVVGLDIGHAATGDLTITLTGPTGAVVRLVDRRGAAGDDFLGTSFDDVAATAIATGGAPFLGTFRPEQPLAAFRGLLASGTWTLRVADLAGGNDGTLRAWSIEVTSIDSPAMTLHDGPASGPAIANGQAGAAALDLGPGSPGLAPSTTRTITIANSGNLFLLVKEPALAGTNPTDFTVSAPGFPAWIAPQGIATFDLAFSPGVVGARAAGVTMDHGSKETTATPFTFEASGVGTGRVEHAAASAGLPLAVPDSVAVGVAATAAASLAVTAPGTIVYVTVSATIAHAIDSDLILTLIHPDGTRVTLANRRGGSGRDFDGTVFDDRAAPPVAGGSAPFRGRFAPDGALAALAGKPAAGTWRLEAADLAPRDAGTVLAFGIDIGIAPMPAIELRLGTAGGTPIPSGLALAAIAFGDRPVGSGASAPVAVAVVNTGTAPLTLGSPIAPAGFVVDATGLARTIARGASSTFTVAFAPPAQGFTQGFVSLPHDAPVGGSPYTFGASGTGTGARIVAIDVLEGGVVLANGGLLDLGPRIVDDGPGAARRIEIRNDGTIPLNVTAPAVSGATPGIFIIDAAGFATVLAPGASTSFTVRFDPPVAAVAAGTLSIAHDVAGEPSPFTLSLRGTGTSSRSSSGGGGCSSGGRPDPATPVLAAALVLFHMARRALGRVRRRSRA